MSRLAAIVLLVAVLAAAFVWIFRTDARVVARFGPNDEYTRSAAFTPDGKILATSYSGTRLWDADTGKQIAELPDVFGGYKRTIALLSDPCVGVGVAGRLPWAMHESQHLTLFSCRGDALTTLTPTGLATGNVQEMTVIPACRLILVRFTKGVVVIDAVSHSIRTDLTALFPKEAQAIAGGGRSCTAFVGVDQSQQEGSILRVDLEKGQVAKLSNIPVSTGFADASPIALSADEKRLAVVFRTYTEATSPCDAVDSDTCMSFSTHSRVRRSQRTRHRGPQGTRRSASITSTSSGSRSS